MVESLEAQLSPPIAVCDEDAELPRCLMPQQFWLCDFLPTASHAAVEPGLGGPQRLAKVLMPRWVREVSRAQQRDALPSRPPGERVQAEVSTAGAGVLRVDVQIRDERVVRGHAASCHTFLVDQETPRRVLAG